MFEQGSFVYCLLSCSCHAWAGRSGCLDLAKGILCSSSCVILEAPRVGCLASYAMFVLGGRIDTVAVQYGMVLLYIVRHGVPRNRYGVVHVMCL